MTQAKLFSTSVTVAVITRKRPLLLTRCLMSLSRQTRLPDKIIIIDNDPALSAREVYQQFSSALPISYYNEPSRGAPFARNSALKKCATRYLAFIDDDCMATAQWLSAGMTAIQQRKCAFVVGKSKLYSNNNLIAREQYQHYAAWFRTVINIHTFVVKPEGLDTKNTLFDTYQFNKTHIQFDTDLTTHSISGGEDADFGIQLDNAGLHGTYAPNMVLFHSEINSFFPMLKKAYFRGKLHKLFDSKWGRIYKFHPLVHLIFMLFKRTGKTFILACLLPVYSSRQALHKKIIQLLVICHDLSFYCGYHFQRSYKDISELSAHERI